MAPVDALIQGLRARGFLALRAVCDIAEIREGMGDWLNSAPWPTPPRSGGECDGLFDAGHRWHHALLMAMTVRLFQVALSTARQQGLGAIRAWAVTRRSGDACRAARGRRAAACGGWSRSRPPSRVTPIWNIPALPIVVTPNGSRLRWIVFAAGHRLRQTPCRAAQGGDGAVDLSGPRLANGTCGGGWMRWPQAMHSWQRWADQGYGG